MDKILFLLSFLIIQRSYSQNCNYQGVIFNEEKFQIEYVNIEIYSDTTFIDGCATDVDGKFKFTNLDCNKKYTILIRHVGFFEIKEEIQASDSQRLSTFVMKPDTLLLTEVTIKSKKPRIERKADRLIYHVSESFLFGNSSALEVLKTAPSVWVDGNGGIRINGKRGVNVSINGEPVKMNGIQLQNYLNSIDGKDVLKIEVIAVPGAEFDAQNNGGMINIEIKKKLLDGYNARIFGGYELGKYPEYSTGIFSNYKKGKLTATANFYIFQRNNFTDNREERSNPLNSFILNSSYFNKTKVDNNQIRVGVDYELNSSNIIKIEHVRTFNINSYDINSKSNLKNIIVEQTINGMYDTKSRNVYNGTSLNYQWKIDTLGSMLKIISDFIGNDNMTNGLFLSDYFDPDDTFIRNNTIENQLDQLSSIFSGKLDYQKNYLRGNSIQIGTRYSYSQIKNGAFERQRIDTSFVINPLRTTDFTYSELIYAAYLNYSGSIKNIQYKLGLRIEDSYVKGISNDNLTLFDVRYFNLFPSTFLLWEFGKDKSNALSMALNRNINRPSFEALNPFEYVLNEFSVSRGNPALRPEYSSNAEIGYTYLDNYSFSLFYTKSKDIINNVLIANEKNAISETRNLANQYSFGFSLNFSFSPIKDLLQSYMYLSATNNNYHSLIVNESLTSYFIRLNNNINLNKNLKANISFSYGSKELYGNRIYDPYGQIDFNISKYLLEKKINISIGVMDLMKFQNKNAVLVDSSEKIAVREVYQSRKFQLFIFYNFSAGKSFNKEKIESADSGEKSRLKH